MPKICNTCGARKPLRDFYRYRKGKPARVNICKRCSAARVKAWQEANREKVSLANLRWRTRFPERCRAIARRNYHRHKERFLTYSKAWNAAHPNYQREMRARRKAARAAEMR